MSLLYKDLEGTNTVVYCATQEEWDTVYKLIGSTQDNWFADPNEGKGISYCISLENRNNSCSLEYYKGRNYTVLDAKDFIEVNTWQLPQKWYLRGSADFRSWMISNYPKANVWGDATDYYYTTVDENNFMKWKNVRDEKGYTEITFEQFKQYVMKEEVKKITGYRLKKDSIVNIAGSIYSKIGQTDGTYMCVVGKFESLMPEAVENNTEWFEPIYEEIYKEGDLVTDDEGKNIYKYGKKIGNMHYPEGSDTTFGPNLRKATAEEIKIYKKSVVINGYMSKKVGYLITFGCYKFTKEQLGAYKYLLNQEGGLAKINVKGTEITVEIIDKLLNLLK